MSVYQGGGCVASASNARLYFEDDQDRKRIRACCASSRDLQWIKVDLERVNQITAVATQGNTVIVSSDSNVSPSSEGKQYLFKSISGLS